jgi:predicted kinase
MELQEAGRRELALRLVDAYRDAGGDPGSDALLAFFAGYRAQVRAKVSLTRASQLDGAEAARKLTRAMGLLRVGERHQWSARTPLVIAVAGLSASGKSTLARRLASTSGYPQLNSDVIRKQRGGLPPTARAPVALYDDAVDQAVYSELGRRARQDARHGVITDATFRRRADRDAFREALGDGIPVLVVECSAPAHVLESRARAREGDPNRVSDAGVEIVRRQLNEAEPLDEIAARDHVPVRSDQPVERMLAAVADALDRRILDP